MVSTLHKIKHGNRIEMMRKGKETTLAMVEVLLRNGLRSRGLDGDKGSLADLGNDYSRQTKEQVQRH